MTRISIEEAADRGLSYLARILKPYSMYVACVHVCVPENLHPETPAPPTIQEHLDNMQNLAESKAPLTHSSTGPGRAVTLCHSLLEHLGFTDISLKTRNLSYASQPPSVPPSVLVQQKSRQHKRKKTEKHKCENCQTTESDEWRLLHTATGYRGWLCSLCHLYWETNGKLPPSDFWHVSEDPQPDQKGKKTRNADGDGAQSSAQSNRQHGATQKLPSFAQFLEGIEEQKRRERR